MDSLLALAVQQWQQQAALWNDGSCPVHMAELDGFTSSAMACYLCYFPILAVAVHTMFLLLIVAQHVRSQIRPGKESEHKNLAKLHPVAKFLCVVLLLLDVVHLWPLVGASSSTSALVLYSSEAVVWLTIFVALQREEAKGRAIYGNILKAWWVAFVVLSTTGFSAAAFSGQILTAILEIASLTSLLFLALSSFSGGVYSDRVEKMNGVDNVIVPLLSESLPEEATIDAPRLDSGFRHAGFLSVLAFLWLNPLLNTGLKRPLKLTDVPLLDPTDAPKTNHEAFQEEWKRQKLAASPGTILSMSWTLFKTFWRSFVVSLTLVLLLVMAQFVAPLLQNQLIKFMEEEHRMFSAGFTLVFALLTGKLAESTFGHQLNFRSRKLGLRMWAGVGCAVPTVEALAAGRKKEKRVGKMTFVEHRTALHVYHSFHRLWIFFTVMLQAMMVVAFCNEKINSRTFKKALSVGPTYFVMKTIQCKVPGHLLFLWLLLVIE